MHSKAFECTDGAETGRKNQNRIRPARTCHSPYISSCLRHTSSGRWGRFASYTTAPRSCQPVNNTALYTCEFRTTNGSSSSDPPACKSLCQVVCSNNLSKHLPSFPGCRQSDMNGPTIHSQSCFFDCFIHSGVTMTSPCDVF